MLGAKNKKWKTCKTISQNVDSCSFWVVGKVFPLPLLIFSVFLKFTALCFLNFLVIIYFLKNQKRRKIFLSHLTSKLWTVFYWQDQYLGRSHFCTLKHPLVVSYISDVSNSEIVSLLSKLQILYKSKARQEERIC